jgi:class 3 adenylate cyclase/tetratricopeptide (TPR) repeat protein
MECPKCHAENSKGRRFCAECGVPLAIACLDCGFANDPGAKFCGGCGVALDPAAVSFADSRHKRETLEPERRHLTVMFCDLVGSTTLAERVDPEELHTLLAQYQDICAEMIHRYDGHIARYVGDGLLVYFGYPKAHEDDAQRSVCAGLDIVEAIHDLETEIADPNVNLAVRIGIVTGLVVAGDIGSGERVEEKAIVGETPNLAARLQALAQPDTVVVGASTHRLVEGLFDCDNLGSQHLKGISQAVTAYRVRAASGARSRFEAAARRGLTPLVGREEEIGLLLKRWQQAKDDEGQTVLLSGEAGSGKSRIVRGFREHLGDEPHSSVLYYCSPYHQHSAFYPAIDQLGRALRFDKHDTPNRKLDKLDTALRKVGLPVTDFGGVLASFLSLPASKRYPALAISPDDRKKRVLEAIIALINAMTSRQPVLMVVEDVQWIDPSTLELVGLLIDLLRSARVLVLVTFRPEFESSWSDYAHVTALRLNKLSQKECAIMVTKVIGGKTFPAKVIERIVAKTDGVPLFIEELTKNLLESGLLEEQDSRFVLAGPLPALAIPESLQDSLMARLDRLTTEVKDVAQLAAALGRTFSHELMAAVTRLEEKELNDALTQLVAAGLVYRHGLPPATSYEFKHALVQDTAYQSLLKSTRQEYHQRIARVLEERFPHIVETQPELLAHHYTEGHLPENATSYWQIAAERAAEGAAYMEALAHLAKGLDLIKTLPATPERAKEELAMCLRQAESLHFLGRREEIVSLLLQQQEHVERLRDPALAGGFYFWLGFAHAWLGHRAEATQSLCRSLEEAERSGDEAIIGKAHRALALECIYSGRPLDEAIAHGREAVSRLERTADRFWLSQALFALSCCCYFAGDFDSAVDVAARLDVLGETTGNRRAQANGIMMAGLSYATRGEWAAGVETLQRALEMSPDPFETAFILACLGKAYSEEGELGRAVPVLEQAVELADQVRSRQWRAWFRTWLGEAYLLARQMDRAQELLSQTLEICTDVKFVLGIGLCHQVLGRIAHARNGLSEAGRHLDTARETFANVQSRFELGRTHLELASLAYTRGNHGAATANLREARSLFKTLEIPKYVERTEQVARRIGVSIADVSAQ